MERRRLGQSELFVAPVAFGGNVFGWTVTESEAFRLLDSFVDAGLNLIDTADVYSRWVPGNTGGESETIIGRWLAKHPEKREQIVLATKVGMEWGPNAKGLSRQRIRKAIDDSLGRLQCDYIDLYQAHRDDSDCPLEETLSAFTDLIANGKVRFVGASNYSGERLAEALAISEREKLAPYVSLQPEYNLYDRAHYETELEPVCESNGVGVITYYTLARGFLSGKYRSPGDIAGRPRADGLKKYFTERGERILAALDELAAETGAQQAAVAVAWVAARPSVTAAIASATRADQLRTLVSGAALQLTPSQIRHLDTASGGT